jgi:hypothetical protein
MPVLAIVLCGGRSADLKNLNRLSRMASKDRKMAAKAIRKMQVPAY